MQVTIQMNLNVYCIVIDRRVGVCIASEFLD